jgi:hypothetical protein
MIAGPADIKRLNVDEAKPIEIEPVDKRVDSPHRILLCHVLVKTRREQRALLAINPLQLIRFGMFGCQLNGHAPGPWLASRSLSPEILEPVRRQGRINGRARDQTMTERTTDRGLAKYKPLPFGRPTSRCPFGLDRLPSGDRDHDKLNLDRLFANFRGVSHHRCVPGQHKAGDQLLRKATGEHQGLSDAARNVGKPLQCAVLVGCYAICP